MAKRSRLTAKPGQRRPLQRSTGRSAEAGGRPVGSVTAAEEARAAELEAQIVAEEKAADEARRGRAKRALADPLDAPIARGYSGVPLSVRAADEYAYVKRDIRRISVVGGFLIAILVVLEILVNGMHLFTL